jgi:arabinose-5-phosphate isomerase
VLQADDVVLALSYSGETEELLRLLETIKRLGAKLIAMTGDESSTLAQAADVALDCRVSEEACPLNLVPTASTTASLALGDALAMALLVAKGFRQEDFATRHPGGKIGKRLMRVEQLMHAGEHAPIVRARRRHADVIYEISSKGLGMACVVDADGALKGIITDGDLRRHMVSATHLLERTAGEIMTVSPITVPRTPWPRRRCTSSSSAVSPPSWWWTSGSTCSASSTCTTSGASRCSDQAGLGRATVSYG